MYVKPMEILGGNLKRLPRSLKVIIIASVLFVLVTIAFVAVLVLLLLIKLVTGGIIPSLLQPIQDFIQSSLGPLINLWKNIQNLIGN